MVIVGLWEIGGAVGLLVPRVAPYAAIALITVMLGALATELLNQSILGPVMPLVHLGLLSIVLTARWPFPSA